MNLKRCYQISVFVLFVINFSMFFGFQTGNKLFLAEVYVEKEAESIDWPDSERPTEHDEE